MKSYRFHANHRQGSTLIVVCILLALMMVAVAFSVDMARIQLTQLELQSAADLASRAGAEAMSRGIGDPNDLVLTDAVIRDEILMVAQLNKAGGGPLSLASGDITFGQGTTSGPSVVFSPTPSGAVTNTTDSVRVSTGLNNYPVVFGLFVGCNDVAVGTQAAAMVQERDIVVVLDRSTSMLTRDVGSINLSDYPANLRDMEDALYVVGDPYHPDTVDTRATATRDTELDISGGLFHLTRMQALKLAVLTFRQEIDKSHGHESLGLTTYAVVANSPAEGQVVSGGNTYDVLAGLSADELSQIVGSGITMCGMVPPYTQHPAEKNASALETDANNYASFNLNYLAMRWARRTNIVDGINKGVSILFGPGSRPFATPVLILMTDGDHNQSGSPEATATAAMAAHPDLQIYTVSFGAGANQSVMGNIATIGNGKHLHASNYADLVSAFGDLAQSAGVTLIQ